MALQPPAVQPPRPLPRGDEELDVIAWTRWHMDAWGREMCEARGLEPDDMPAAVWLRFDRARSRGSSIRSPERWVGTALRGVILDALRARLRHEMRQVRIAEAMAEEADAGASATPEELVAAAELGRRLATDRQVLVELAEILPGSDRSAEARSRRVHAVRDLQAALGHYVRRRRRTLLDAGWAARIDRARTIAVVGWAVSVLHGVEDLGPLVRHPSRRERS